MLRKLGRLLMYLKNVLLLIVLCPVAALLRRCSPAYRHLWLVSERGNDARDNGYWFYRYLRTQHPDANACYVIDPDSPDYARVSQLGRTVRQGTLQHYLQYLAADYLVGSHVQPAAPNLMIFYHLRQIGVHPRGVQAFLQHGIIKDDMQWMRYPRLKVDFFASGAKMEYDYLKSEFGFPDGVVRYTGLCRFDNLMRGKKQTNQVLVMPTWRGSRYPQGEAFCSTSFYQHFQALLSSPELLRLLEAHDLQLIFYPHIELQKELDRFESPSPRILLADWRSYDVQTLLMDCCMLITDYSSVYFDVGYMEKPVIYYQFDKEEFRKIHYQKGYFSYEEHGFGPVVESLEPLLQALQHYAENGFGMEPEYLARLEAFFPVRDEQNCERTWQAITELGEKS